MIKVPVSNFVSTPPLSSETLIKDVLNVTKVSTTTSSNNDNEDDKINASQSYNLSIPLPDADLSNLGQILEIPMMDKGISYLHIKCYLYIYIKCY